MKHALVFITDMDYGGRQTYCLTLLNEWARSGRKCGLYVSYGGGGNLSRLDASIGTYVAGGAISKSIRKVLAFVKKYPSDTPCLSLSTEITIVLCFLKKIGLIRNPIYHRESMDARSLNWKWRNLARLFYPTLSGMITTSEAMKNTYSRLYRVRHPVAVIRSPSRFSSSDVSKRDVGVSARSLLSVTRLDPVKGHDRLIRALATHGKGYTLEICGEGSFEPQIVEMINAANVADRVKLVGHVLDVESVYAKGGILVMSSYHEGLPNALIEAIVCGCRAVVPENLDGAAELMRELGLGESIVSGDFETNLIATVEKVVQQPCEVWRMARQKLVAMTRADTVSQKVWDFIQGEK